MLCISFLIPLYMISHPIFKISSLFKCLTLNCRLHFLLTRRLTPLTWTPSFVYSSYFICFLTYSPEVDVYIFFFTQHLHLCSKSCFLDFHSDWQAVVRFAACLCVACQLRMAFTYFKGLLQKQQRIIWDTDCLWPAKREIFTIWVVKGKVCFGLLPHQPSLPPCCTCIIPHACAVSLQCARHCSKNCSCHFIRDKTTIIKISEYMSDSNKCYEEK